jgi:hypothetical protein
MASGHGTGHPSIADDTKKKKKVDHSAVKKGKKPGKQ